MNLNANRTYTEYRGALAHRGLSLRSWARRNRLPIGSVYNAVKSHRNGPRAIGIRSKLDRFINENQPS
jgi:hypothetical protein